MVANTMQVSRPKPMVSTRGTTINNTAGLDPNQLKRVTQLANTGYGTKAQQVANTLTARSATNPATGVPPTGGTTGGVPQTQTPANNNAGGVLTGTTSTANTNLPANTLPGNQPAKKAQPWQVPTDSATLQSQRDHIAAGIAARQAKGIKSPQDQARLDKIDAAIAANGTGGTTTDPNHPFVNNPESGGNTVGPNGELIGPDGKPVVNPNDNGSGSFVGNPGDASNVLFPSQQAFEPTDYNGSPLYKWQQQEGQKALNAVLAKRGLLDSGAEIQADTNFQNQLGAQEADKARGYAQNEADRYERMSENEANRRTNNQNSADDNLYKWTSLLLGQNPMQYASQGTGDYATATGNEAKMIASYLPQLYAHASGGGGGGGPGPFIPPFPSGPDDSGINEIGALMNGSSSNSGANSIINSLPGLFDPKNWA